MALTTMAPPPTPPTSSTPSSSNLQTPQTSSQLPPSAATSRVPTPLVDTAPLSKNLTEPVSPTSPHAAEDAARAMSSMGAWQPRLDRRQSWDSQEYKHMMQGKVMRPKPVEEEVKDKVVGGFTEGR